MTVEVLHLSGLDDADGGRAAMVLLADFRAYPDLSRLLVIDDTAALMSHSDVYERLLTSHRMDHLLCVAVGPRAGGGRVLRFPGNIGGGQGSSVLWVSDPEGIDCRLAAAAIAVGHPASTPSGLGHLIELLSVVEVFDRVCETAKRVPGGVASPGLRLAGADDETASFAAALGLAIQGVTGPDPAIMSHGNEPFSALLATRPTSVSLTEDGELWRYREEVIASATAASAGVSTLAGLSGLLGFSPPDVRTYTAAAGAPLAAFHGRVARLLRDAHAPGGLNDRQHGQLKAAGVRLPDRPLAMADYVPSGVAGRSPRGADAERSPVYQVIAQAVRDGDPLPRVTSRLRQTASALDSGGSLGYLPQLDQVCPPALIGRLSEPPPVPRPARWWLPTAGIVAAALGLLAAQWNAPAGVAVGLIALLIGVAAALGPWRARVRAWRRELALDDAVHSADGLAALVTTVAAREWSDGTVTRDEVARARIILDGVTARLAQTGTAGGPGGTARAARLSESLLPGLRDLVLAVLAAGLVTDGAGGQAAFDQAQAKTADLIRQWTEFAGRHGALAQPPFVTVAADDVRYAADGEITEIAEVIQHDPREVMWQLCTPGDLSALDLTAAPQVVAFAPRLIRPALADVLPQDTVWASSGAHTGLLRLVPLRAGIASASWTADGQRPEPPL